MFNEIRNLIIQLLKSSADDYEIEELKNCKEDTKLYNGLGGCLDSLALVSLVSDLEALLSEKFGKDIVLADEKMMSSRNSPFKDVNSLTEYVVQKIEK
ncbi:hypothetical protein [Campylobacter molothri]|uniref:hypothetical protein n=1 Tax=Campylobacter molothri TaxID=1032242 RepID=UPI0035B17763